MSDYRDQLDYQTDHDADPVDADRELAAFLLSYVRSLDASSAIEQHTQPAEQPKETESEY